MHPQLAILAVHHVRRHGDAGLAVAEVIGLVISVSLLVFSERSPGKRAFALAMIVFFSYCLYRWLTRQ